MSASHPAGRFIVIGENIHASRVVRRDGRHVVTLPGGQEAVGFADGTGAPRALMLPDSIRDSQDALRGRIKHVRAAVIAGMSAAEPGGSDGRAYLQALAARQIEAGADYLDLNVDELSAADSDRQAAMRWLVGVVEEVSPVPIALDSSSPDVIQAGLEQWQGRVGRPLVNSASLERLDVLDLAAAGGCPVVISAVGTQALPASAEERVANASRMVQAAMQRGLAPGQLFVDPLVMPAAAHPDAAAHCLEAITRLRSSWGPGIHITGGFSNVSFGLPARRLVNDTFLALAIDAGADSGIIDPLTSDPARAVAIDRASRPYQLALDLLLGRDRYGRQFLAAYRAGRLGTTTTP